MHNGTYFGGPMLPALADHLPPPRPIAEVLAICAESTRMAALKRQSGGLARRSMARLLGAEPAQAAEPQGLAGKAMASLLASGEGDRIMAEVAKASGGQPGVRSAPSTAPTGKRSLALDSMRRLLAGQA